MSSFPTVATVIGVSQEIAKSGPLLATLAIDPSLIATSVQPLLLKPVEIKVNDPVTQAVVDNIIGKHPTKKEPVKIKCELCNITVSSQEILEAHYAGAKHTRKLKALELVQEIQNSNHSTILASNAQDGSSLVTTEFSCKICKVTLNSYLQLEQHLNGTKHNIKVKSSKSNTVEVPDNSFGCKGVMAVDIGLNRLYCAACNVQVNSTVQFHQHITSTKHSMIVNCKHASTVKRLKSGKKPRRFSGRWISPRGRGGIGGMGPRDSRGHKTTGWSPSSSNMGLNFDWTSHSN